MVKSFPVSSKPSSRKTNAPGVVTVKVDGNKMTVVSGADIVQRAADEGFGYVAAQLAKD